MTTPKRIQRQRIRGWRMPENAVYVGRPTVYGNPIMVERRNVLGPMWVVWLSYGVSDDGAHHSNHDTPAAARKVAVDLFDQWLDGRLSLTDDRRRQPMLDALPALAGKTLACWCPLTDRCHGDVLLRRANQGQR